MRQCCGVCHGFVRVTHVSSKPDFTRVEVESSSYLKKPRTHIRLACVVLIAMKSTSDSFNRIGQHSVFFISNFFHPCALVSVLLCSYNSLCIVNHCDLSSQPLQFDRSSCFGFAFSTIWCYILRKHFEGKSWTCKWRDIMALLIRRKSRLFVWICGTCAACSSGTAAALGMWFATCNLAVDTPQKLAPTVGKHKMWARRYIHTGREAGWTRQ